MTDQVNPENVMDSEVQQELDQAMEELTMADAMTPPSGVSSPDDGRTLKAGDMKRARIVGIHHDDVFVEFGGKDQGVCPLESFGDEKPRIGESLEFKLLSFLDSEGMWKVSRQAGVEKATWETLEQGMMVSATVTGMNTGGLELKVAGQRAFMPASQVDVHSVDNFAPYLNKKLECKVIELNKKRKKIVLSHRAVVEEANKVERDKAMTELEEGAVMTGTVRNIQKFGAFVELAPGLDGLVHVSDMAYNRVKNPNDVVKVGDQLQVKILKIDKEKGKLSLGMKQVEPDPWSQAESEFTPGEEVSGRVVKLADFGAFVELAPGVEGLIPMSEMGWHRVDKASDVLAENQTVRVKIVQVDQKRRRLTLSLKQLSEDPWSQAAEQFAQGAKVKGKVTRTTGFGAFVELAPGVEGLIHISALAGGRVNSVEDVVNVGQEVEALVVSVDPDQHRIGLSIKALTEPDAAHERGGGKVSKSDVRGYLKRQGDTRATESLGSLLDKFGSDPGSLKGGLG